MTVSHRLPIGQQARIGGRRHNRALEDLKNFAGRRRPTVVVFRRDGKKAQRDDLRPVAAILVRQQHREPVHQRIPGVGVERPLIGRDAGRQTEHPTVAIGFAAPVRATSPCCRRGWEGDNRSSLRASSKLGALLRGTFGWAQIPHPLATRSQRLGAIEEMGAVHFPVEWPTQYSAPKRIC